MGPMTSTWAEAVGAFDETLRRHLAGAGRDPGDAAAAGTIRTNTELVPKRAENITRLLRELAGVQSIEGRRVLELGCGFGALASYLALVERPAELLAVDAREDYVALATEAAAGIAGPVPRFMTADMRTLEGIEPASVDVAIYNNSFIYLPSRSDMRTALATLRRVLRPGGHALFFHANRLAWRDPFTRAPIVHLLPPSLADRTRWSHSHARVRLVSPDGLRLMLYRAGLRSVRSGAFMDGGLSGGVKSRFARFYGLGATLPA